MAALAVAPVLALTLLARYFMLPFESGDWIHGVGPWMEFISEHDGFAALKHDFSIYNVPYLYLLVTVYWFGEAPYLVEVKGISIIFDYLMGFFVYRIVRLKYAGWVPILAGLATVCAPTVVINGSAWAQCDAIYTAFLVMSLYYLLVRREKTACIAFGLAFSFKGQAIFLAPLFLWLLARQEIRLRSLFLIPAVWLGLLLPAWLIGRPLDELLLIHANRLMIETYPLNLMAPNLYAWVPTTTTWTSITTLTSFFKSAGLIATIIFVVVTGALLRMSRTKLTKDAMVLLAAFSVLVIPYIMPGMHDRYFFPADVISIILGFHISRLWYVPVMLGLSSLLASGNYLLDHTAVPFGGLALFMLFPIGVLGQEVVRTFARQDLQPGSGPQPQGRAALQARIRGA